LIDGFGSRAGYAYAALLIIASYLAVHGALFDFLVKRSPGVLAWGSAAGG
jgi:hypothetical protein